jgi:uncharacterized membrane protein YcaP (DUF421 family)
MEPVHYLFEKEENLSAIQMCARAAIVFVAALLIMKLGSIRAFGNQSAIDTIVMIVLGGILSRVITGAAAFVPVMATTVTMVALHKLLAWACTYSHWLGNIVKGEKKILYENGQMLQGNMKALHITEEDLKQGIRCHLNEAGTANVQEIYIERSGEISVVKKTAVTGNTK